MSCNDPVTQIANCFYVFKDADPSDGTEFPFGVIIGQNPLINFELADGEFRGFAIPGDPSVTVLVNEFVLPGWTFVELSCPPQQQSGVFLQFLPTSGFVDVGRDPQATGIVFARCTFFNS